jgi:hypothetical protein
LINEKQNTKIAVSGCGTQMALVHPQGRVLQYNARIEVQSQRSWYVNRRLPLFIATVMCFV